MFSATKISVLEQQIFQRAPINIFQGLYLGDGDMFIDLVNAGIRRAEFDDLGAYLRNKPAIRGTAGS